MKTIQEVDIDSVAASHLRKSQSMWERRSAPGTETHRGQKDVPGTTGALKWSHIYRKVTNILIFIIKLYIYTIDP